MLITIIAFTIIIVISSIQAYTNWLARNKQDTEIEELKALCTQLDNLANKKANKIKSLWIMVTYRNKRIDELEKRIAKLTWDKKILRGRKLTK